MKILHKNKSNSVKNFGFTITVILKKILEKLTKTLIINKIKFDQSHYSF